MVSATPLILFAMLAPWFPYLRLLRKHSRTNRRKLKALLTGSGAIVATLILLTPASLPSASSGPGYFLYSPLMHLSGFDSFSVAGQTISASCALLGWGSTVATAGLLIIAARRLFLRRPTIKQRNG